jgi:hypothetical protein
MPLVILYHLLNVSVQLANKRGFTKRNLYGNVTFPSSRYFLYPEDEGDMLLRNVGL